MANAIPQMPPFLTWWQEVNSHLFWRGLPDMNLGDARYWFGRNYSPPTAAELHAEETTT